MKKTTSDDLEQDKALPDFERLMQIKALSHERLAFQRGALRAKYESLTSEEKAIVDAKFHKMAMKIAAQFGRSRPFIFSGNDGGTSSKKDED